MVRFAMPRGCGWAPIRPPGRLARRRPASDKRASIGRAALVHVIALITTKPGLRDEVLAIFRANVPAVLAEAGCVAYEPTVDAAGFGGPQAELGPDTIVVVERWASRETLKAHGVAPHMKAYAERVKDMLAGRVIHVLEPV